jgi:2-dehydro-3-deoxyphosphogluconate aldolase / (4S)-4-hydroxy-2-oxoglutarate aldolase
MDTLAWLKLLKQERAIAVIRISDWTLGLPMAQAVHAGGMNLIEVTWNSDRPAQLLTQLRSALPNCIIGAGTIKTPIDCQAAIDAGAQFIVSPGLQMQVLAQAIAAHIPIVPGAMTPTEILTAWQAGASCVKVFPIHLIGGPAFIRSIRDPLGEIPLLPTGGVTLDNAAALCHAGAIAVGLGSDLFPKSAIASSQWQIIQQQAETLISRLKADG